MNLGYTLLDTTLRPYADAAASFFASNWGLPATSFKPEMSIGYGIAYRPTFHSRTRDHHVLCVDVGPSYFTTALDAFVLESMLQGIPVLLYVALAPDSPAPPLDDLKNARKKGVGTLATDIAPGNNQLLHQALSLSLTGVRRPNISEFPAKLRQPVSNATTKFLAGAPDDACLDLYKEVEQISRRLADCIHKNNYWLSGNPLPKKLRWPKDQWARVIKAIIEHVDLNKVNCPQLTAPLLNRIAGITDFRNEVGHKPRSTKELIKRDTSLRTRFESAHDMLRDLAEAVKPLKI